MSWADTLVVFFSQEAFVLGTAGTLSVHLWLNLGKGQMYECTVLIFQYLVQLLEMAKWRDAFSVSLLEV